ncbi:hypothetical protein [Lysobacter sp. CA199]|uniref:hypothetical protein n=1 Tax=Lysobacter sp. CA199 TaxID=3455608 RepID=UPI003F8D7F7E
MLNYLRLILHSLSAMAAAATVLVLTNLAGGTLAQWWGFARGGKGRLAWDLGWVIAGGVLAVAVATRCAPAAPRRHGLVCAALIAAVTVYAVIELGEDFPRWFCAGLLLSVPLQAWLGTKWGSRRSG